MPLQIMEKNDLSREITNAITDHVWKCYRCGRQFKKEQDQRKHENDTHFKKIMASAKQIFNENSEIRSDSIRDIEDEIIKTEEKNLPTPLFEKEDSEFKRIRGKRWFKEKSDNIKTYKKLEKVNSRREHVLRILGGKCVWPKCAEPYDHRLQEIDHIKNDGKDDRKGKALHEKIIDMLDNGYDVFASFQILCGPHNKLKWRLNLERQKVGRHSIEKIDENTRWFEGEKEGRN